MPDFLRTPGPDGNLITRLDRLDDGQFACCICFNWVRPENAWADPAGQRWDMCRACGQREAGAGALIKLAKIHELVRHARTISPSPGMSVYAVDLERILGLIPADTPTPHVGGMHDEVSR